MKKQKGVSHVARLDDIREGLDVWSEIEGVYLPVRWGWSLTM